MFWDLFLYFCAHMYKYVHICAGAFGGQKRVLDSLESQAVMSWLTCVLGTGLGSSETEADIFNCETSLQAHFLLFPINLFPFREFGNIKMEIDHSVSLSRCGIWRLQNYMSWAMRLSCRRSCLSYTTPRLMQNFIKERTAARAYNPSTGEEVETGESLGLTGPSNRQSSAS